MNEIEGKTFHDVLRAIVSLQDDSRFVLLRAFFGQMLESARIELETAREGFRENQGRISALREVLHHFDNAKETLRALESAGQSGIEPTR